MRFHYRLTRGDVAAQDIPKHVETLLNKLSLKLCADTVLGDPGSTGGLSGGERKRLNVGLSLVSEPQLLFLDEPTSGLDSKKARSLMIDMRKISAETGCTVVSTIHQPSLEVFSLFTKVMLLHMGRLRFFGTIPELLMTFEKIGKGVPIGENVADFVIDYLDVSTEAETLQLSAAAEKVCSKPGGTASPKKDDANGPQDEMRNVSKLSTNSTTQQYIQHIESLALDVVKPTDVKISPEGTNGVNSTNGDTVVPVTPTKGASTLVKSHAAPSGVAKFKALFQRNVLNV